MYSFPEEIRKAYERIPIPLVIDQFIDEKVVPLLVSDGFCKQVNISRVNVIKWFSGSQFERIHPDDVGNVARISDEFAHHRGDYNVIFRSRHKDGYHFIHAIGQWMIMEDGSELALLVYTDVTESGNTIIELSEQYGLFQKDRFYTDSLTTLPNINYLNQFADEHVNTIRVGGGTPALIYTDTHSMKFYNNKYGVTHGNELLRMIAEELKDAFPEGLVMRGADDHFVVIDSFPGRDELTGRISAANDRIRKRAYGNTSGIQAGIILYEEDTTTAEAVDQARQAVRLIKDDLNKTVKYYTLTDDESYWNQRYILENFARALKEGWIRIYYQCISRVDSNKGAALEALARWIDPVRGMIPPDEFIPVLRKYHLLYKLDLYIAEQVCKEIPVRKDVGFSLIPVSMNFTAQDFDYVDIPAELNALYDRYEMSRYVGKECFIIEITEQDIVSATDRFREQLGALRSDGYRLWLDDFGSGYSALSMFSRFDFDLIKFDMDLLRRLDEKNGANRRIIRAMIGVAKEMGIQTLAEGMETEEQRQFLIECGCDLAQGYLFHKAEALDTMLYKLKNGQKPKPCETPEERGDYEKKSFEQI